MIKDTSNVFSFGKVVKVKEYFRFEKYSLCETFTCKLK